MRLRTITVDDLLSRQPCMSADKLRSLVAQRAPRRWRMNALQIIRAFLGAVDDGDLLWVVLHESLIDERLLRELACDFAERALQKERDAGREPHPDSWRAIEVARHFSRGEVDEAELATAHARAAVYVAFAVSEDVAYAAYAAANAAYAAAYAANAANASYAATYAAENAARAAYAAALPHASDAARAERRWQVDHVLETLSHHLAS